MRYYVDLSHWKDREIINLILRNCEDLREEILKKAVQLGLREIVRQMKAEGKFIKDRLFTSTEINSLLSEDKSKGYFGFKVSSISSGLGPSGMKV